MQKNKELDYDTLYNGRGEEILKMVLQYFGNDIILLKKEAIIPDRPKRRNIVGVIFTLELYKDYIIICSVNRGISFMIKIISGETVNIDEIDYMTWGKAKELGFKVSNEIVNEKLDIFNNVIQALRNGKKIVKVDVEN